MLYGGSAPGSADVPSPGIGGSCNVALNVVGAMSSTSSCFGVGYSTSKVSMCAFQPHFLNCASIHSALALSCGEPTWFGSDDNCLSHPRISLALNIASKRCSSWRCYAAPVVVKPSMPGPVAGCVAAPAVHANPRHANATPNLRARECCIANPPVSAPNSVPAWRSTLARVQPILLRRCAGICMGQSSRARWPAWRPRCHRTGVAAASVSSCATRPASMDHDSR